MPDLSTSEYIPNSQWMDYLERFNALMATQILRNKHKGLREAWLEYPLEKTLIFLQVSIQELRTALAYGIDVEEKAADVAVYAFIIQDVFANSHPEVDPSDRFSGE